MAEDLAGLLAAGERAAFHGRPANGIASLESAFEQARAEGRAAEAAASAWLLGVCLGAVGKFGTALSVLNPLAMVDAPTSAEQRLFAALAAATSAGVHRQLGQHEQARSLDERALSLSDGGAEASFDSTLGLAADLLGLDDAVSAASYLEQAAGLAANRAEWWRQRIELAWVKAEVALATGDPAAAAATLTPAIASAEVSGAPRYVAKSLLFLGVSQVQGGDLDEATATLRRAATLAESLGVLPLLWPARALLGALVEATSAAESAKSLAAARGAVIAIADDLPEDLRTAWLDREDVAALLGG